MTLEQTYRCNWMDPKLPRFKLEQKLIGNLFLLILLPKILHGNHRFFHFLKSFENLNNFQIFPFFAEITNQFIKKLIILTL